MKINKLEDLEVWKKSLRLCKSVYEITKSLPLAEKFNIKKHMEECARNVPGNIAEGFGRYHYQESIQFYRIARGSLNELKSDLYLIKELGHLNEQQFADSLNLLEEILRMLNGIISTSKNFKDKQY